ncbi:hypothetical protein AMECASPLE_000555 [Ameca splendens]|uniref:Uncharacterized protein n=1 Tax=Ameca splendens TaxID=208324 RepID=A0ABV0YWR8_9TELE
MSSSCDSSGVIPVNKWTSTSARTKYRRVSLCTVLALLALGQFFSLSLAPTPPMPFFIFFILLKADLLYICHYCVPSIYMAYQRQALDALYPSLSSSFSHPSHHAPDSAPTLPQSSLKVPGGMLSGQDKETQRMQQKKP